MGAGTISIALPLLDWRSRGLTGAEYQSILAHGYENLNNLYNGWGWASKN